MLHFDNKSLDEGACKSEALKPFHGIDGVAFSAVFLSSVIILHVLAEVRKLPCSARERVGC